MGKSIVHGIVSLILFAIPFLISSNPEWANLTLGAVLTAFAHWLDGVSQAKLGASVWH